MEMGEGNIIQCGKCTCAGFQTPSNIVTRHCRARLGDLPTVGLFSKLYLIS